MNAWDRLLFGRAALLSTLLLAAAAAVLAATDEPASGAGDRLARLAALSPVLSALAVATLASAIARRGEARALAAIGVGPLRAHAGLALGGSAVSLVLAAGVGAGMGSLGALFPRLPVARWSGAAPPFAWPAGVVVSGAGELSFTTAIEAAAAPLPRGAVALTLVAAAIVFPLSGALPSPRTPRLIVTALSVLVAIAIFHAVAAGAPAGWLLGSVALPLLHAGWLLAPPAGQVR